MNTTFLSWQSLEPAELKQPVIEIISESGWTYRPVFSFKSRALFG